MDKTNQSRQKRRRDRDSRPGNHKLSQLCAQVERALSLTLGGECNDPVLNQLYIDSVTPAPDASRLLVSVIGSVKSDEDLAEIYDALEKARGLLRSTVATELNRKRTPELSFLVLSSGRDLDL